LTEIKSTIDLIMERTRGMTLSPEEKEQYRREDFRKKAKGSSVRLLENQTAADDVLTAIGSEAPEDQRLLYSLLWEEIVRAMPNDDTAVKNLDILDELPQARTGAELLKRVRDFLNDKVKNQSKDRKGILLREKKKLESFGISGSAVVPKIPTGLGGDSDVASAMDGFKKELLKVAGN
jgi:hypothetical protein